VPALAGVLQIAQGDGAIGAALIDVVDAICFTGSVATGMKVAVQAAGRLIPAFLELGGKDPLIITATADLERAITAALRGSVLSTGQACQSIERIYVAADIYGAFVTGLTKAAQAVRFNQPDIGVGEIGPIIFPRQADILADQIADAIAKGAKVLTGGQIEHHLGGLWLAPTVIVDVDHDMKVMRDETFGPIMPVMAFDSVDEAVSLANDSIYGLSAGVIAGSLEEAEAIGRRIDAGGVSLNDAALTSQFYEAEKHSFKQSGLGGSRMGPAGFQRFCRRKALIANHGAVTPLSAYREESL
jgi:succinate-semialdehyde dehydrogenase / glutarate-semialdehyde dehydrogenase